MAVVADADAGADARFTSFRPEALAEVREADPDASLGYLFGADVGVETGLETARELGCDYLHPHAELCIETDVADRADAEGLDVIAWGVDDATTCESLYEVGIHGATADSWTLGGIEIEENVQIEAEEDVEVETESEQEMEPEATIADDYW